MQLRLTIALSQVKTGNTLLEILNKIVQVFYSLYWSKNFAKKSIEWTDSINLKLKPYL